MARKNTVGDSLTVYFDSFSRHTYDRVLKLAKRDKRSVSQTIVLLLEAYFIEQDERNQEPTTTTLPTKD